MNAKLSKAKRSLRKAERSLKKAEREAKKLEREAKKIIKKILLNDKFEGVYHFYFFYS